MRAPEREPDSRPEPDIAALAQRFLAAQLTGDREGALRLVMEEGVGQGVAPERLHLEVVQWAQREIGQRWQRNEITVAQEHLATAISQLVVSSLYPLLPRRSRRSCRVLVACAEGEQHELGARIAADFVEMGGYDVRFLGSNVPTEALVRMVRDWRPHALVLSASTSLAFPGLERAVEAVRAAVGDDFPILAGGAAFGWSRGCALPEGVLCPGRDAIGLVALLDERLAA